MVLAILAPFQKLKVQARAPVVLQARSLLLRLQIAQEYAETVKQGNIPHSLVQAVLPCVLSVALERFLKIEALLLVLLALQANFLLQKLLMTQKYVRAALLENIPLLRALAARQPASFVDPDLFLR